MSTCFPRAVRGFSKIQYLVSVAATLMLAACSQSFERFAENPSDSDPVYTASVPKQSSGSSDEQVTSRPLANSNLRKPNSTYKYSTNYKQPSYKAPAVPQVAIGEPPAVPQSGRVTVGPGMTLYSIAKANQLTVAQLASANNLKPPYAVRQGQVLRVPGVSEAVAPTAHAKPAMVEPVVAKAHSPATLQKAGTHQVASGETLFSLGRKFSVSPYAIADLNGLSHSSTLSLGQSLRIPGSTATNTKQPPAAQETADAETPLVDEEVAAGEPSVEATKQPAVAGQIPAVEPDSETKQVADATVTAPGTSQPIATGMRWPVRGKIISAYGAKPNGLKNEGINIAVPEGTSVRAAESGVVAYAGNELKGYGNLVLIRHEGGWVTAYAHAKELFVKRGDTVKRGDVIAKAGQTGSVSSPQLHFEVRKGATAMDPLKYLSSATAAN